jgi:DNA-directed RNA polymerase subunit H (RpoH/RPB5)
MGMAFANRRTCIEPDQVPMILEEDGYVEIAQPAALMVGDVVVYERDGETTHVAVVVTNDPVP